MPQDDEASIQNSVQETGAGLANDEPAKSAASWRRHQTMSDRTLGFGDKRTKGDEK
jgi:hypothetical protein